MFNWCSSPRLFIPTVFPLFFYYFKIKLKIKVILYLSLWDQQNMSNLEINEWNWKVGSFSLGLRKGQSAVLRSSRLEVFCLKTVLKNFAKFTGKHLCQSPFFHKVGGLRPASLLLKKRLWYSCFPVNLAKIFKNTFFYRTPTVAAFECYNSVGKIHVEGKWYSA